MQGTMFDDWERDKGKMRTSSGATFSPDRIYRYLLWRPGKRPRAYCMLNPSTADELKDDPTIRRCRKFAESHGYDGVVIANAFAYRATKPRALYDLADPIGPENDAAILRAAELGGGTIVCAWGAHGKLRGRGLAVIAMLRAAGHTVKAFGFTKDGYPWHPLYLPGDLQLQDMP